MPSESDKLGPWVSSVDSKKETIQLPLPPKTWVQVLAILPVVPQLVPPLSVRKENKNTPEIWCCKLATAEQKTHTKKELEESVPDGAET